MTVLDIYSTALHLPENNEFYLDIPEIGYHKL